MRCERCIALEAERDEARANVGRCHTLIDGLWAITDPEKHADIVASVDAELAPCDRHFAENEALGSSLSRAVEALREIDRRTGHFGEAPPPPEWMPMLSLIAWVGRTARAVLAEVGK